MPESSRESRGPVRPRGTTQLSEPLVREARAALRGADVYLRALVQRFELARIDPALLDGLPPWALTTLVKDLAVLRVSAERSLRHLDPEEAEAARRVASLFREEAAAATIGRRDSRG